jgi:hypothetical protein
VGKYGALACLVSAACGRVGFDDRSLGSDLIGDGSADANETGALEDAAPCSGATCLGVGLVAYWKLDGDATDASGYNSTLDPSPVSRTPTYTPGKIGSGLQPGMYTTFQTCPSCASLDSPTRPPLEFATATSDDFTLSVWANRTANPAADNTWWQYELLGNDQVRLRVAGTGAAPTPVYPELVLSNGATVLGHVADPMFDMRSAANVGVWVHIVGYRRGNTIGIVVNGTETTASITGSVGAPGTFIVGRAANGYDWQGTLDEVGKWDRALNATELAALYNAGAGLALP